MPQRVVLDTNVLLQAIPTHGIYRPIFIGLRQKRFELVISNDIMLEYEEVLTRQGGRNAWVATNRLLELLQTRTRTAKLVSPSFFWKQIHFDPDDNKFVDAAVCGDCDWIVTEDRHYDVLDTCDLIRAKPIHPSLFIMNYLS